jgi:hypothetical protein
LGAAAAAKPVLETVKVVRDAVDARIITANHWGDVREDWNTERYERKLSDVFGGIEKSKWWASPVRFIRGFADGLTFSLEERVAMILQFGTGHCGEHAATSFSVMKALMDAGNAKFEAVVWSGNTNVDHAFVVGGIRVRDALRITRTIKVGGEEPGVSITIFNLRDTLLQNPGKSGFVLDPYLAPSVQAKTCTDLLASLNAKRRKKKKTDFLRIENQYPEKPDVAVTPLTKMEGI